jgi:hypothetical protein
VRPGYSVISSGFFRGYGIFAWPAGRSFEAFGSDMSALPKKPSSWWSSPFGESARSKNSPDQHQIAGQHDCKQIHQPVDRSSLATT